MDTIFSWNNKKKETADKKKTFEIDETTAYLLPDDEMAEVYEEKIKAQGKTIAEQDKELKIVKAKQEHLQEKITELDDAIKKKDEEGKKLQDEMKNLSFALEMKNKELKKMEEELADEKSHVSALQHLFKLSKNSKKNLKPRENYSGYSILKIENINYRLTGNAPFQELYRIELAAPWGFSMAYHTAEKLWEKDCLSITRLLGYEEYYIRDGANCLVNVETRQKTSNGFSKGSPKQVGVETIVRKAKKDYQIVLFANVPPDELRIDDKGNILTEKAEEKEEHLAATEGDVTKI